MHGNARRTAGTYTTWCRCRYTTAEAAVTPHVMRTYMTHETPDVTTAVFGEISQQLSTENEK